MVSSTSDGRWLTTIAPNPYFLPSFAIFSTVSAANPPKPGERYRWASSITTTAVYSCLLPTFRGPNRALRKGSLIWSQSIAPLLRLECLKDQVSKLGCFRRSTLPIGHRCLFLFRRRGLAPKALGARGSRNGGLISGTKQVQLSPNSQSRLI